MWSLHASEAHPFAGVVKAWHRQSWRYIPPQQITRRTKNEVPGRPLLIQLLFKIILSNTNYSSTKRERTRTPTPTTTSPAGTKISSALLCLWRTPAATERSKPTEQGDPNDSTHSRGMSRTSRWSQELLQILQLIFVTMPQWVLWLVGRNCSRTHNGDVKSAIQSEVLNTSNPKRLVDLDRVALLRLGGPVF